MGRVGFDPCSFRSHGLGGVRKLQGSNPIPAIPGMAGHPCLTLRVTSLQVPSKETRRTLKRDDPGSMYQGSRGSVWIPKPRESGSVIGADRRRSGPSCVLPTGMPQGQTESGGIVHPPYAGPRAPRDGVTRKRRCTYRPSVIY